MEDGEAVCGVVLGSFSRCFEKKLDGMLMSGRRGGLSMGKRIWGESVVGGLGDDGEEAGFAREALVECAGKDDHLMLC